MPVTVAPIADDQFDTVLQAFNEGYEGYVVPFHLEAPQLQGHITSGNIDLSASRMAFDEGRSIGIVLIGIRGQRGWVGGVGVNKAWRGKGIGRQLMQSLIASARERGLSALQLEVIEGNTAAHNLYLSLGFQNTRHLLILDRLFMSPDESTSPTDTGLKIASIPPADALPYTTAFHARPNPWQREPESLSPQTARFSAWTALRDGKIVACTIANAGEKNIQWVDIGCKTGEENALQALIAFVHAQYPQAIGRMVNLPDDDPVWPVLSALGYTESLAQYEMHLTL
ncbi:MAG: GNAT family N-acetyltransferase [Chloroflexota bacterium]